MYIVINTIRIIHSLSSSFFFYRRMKKEHGEEYVKQYKKDVLIKIEKMKEDIKNQKAS